MNTGKNLKLFLKRINFELKRNPRIEKKTNWKKFIPHSYQSVLLIQADFELAWAWRYAKNSDNPLALAYQKAKLERENIPLILTYCEKYNIPISWATVGHMMLSSCEEMNLVKHPEIPRFSQFENQYWRFQGKDWFEYDPCSDYKRAPEWYSPDLINLILESKVKHEIGCHTFSHIDCRDEVCSSSLFKAELDACKKSASQFNINLKSFVHPGFTIGNLKNLADEGFTSYRTDFGNWLGYPVLHYNSLWEIKGSAELTYNSEWSIEYQIYRYKKIIDRAIHSNTVCMFWFHPSFDSVFLEKIFPEVLKYIDEKRDKIFVSTVSDYVDQIDKL